MPKDEENTKLRRLLRSGAEYRLEDQAGEGG